MLVDEVGSTHWEVEDCLRSLGGKSRDSGLAPGLLFGRRLGGESGQLLGSIYFFAHDEDIG